MVNVYEKNGCATVIFEKEDILVPRVFLKLKPRWTLENGMMIITIFVIKLFSAMSPLSMIIVLSPACVFLMCRLSGDERAALLSRN